MIKNFSSLLIIFLFLSLINIECTKSENTRIPVCNKWEVNDDVDALVLPGLVIFRVEYTRQLYVEMTPDTLHLEALKP